MSDQLKKDGWHYLQINRGRYLCAEHGGFCDSSDSYAHKCPLCVMPSDQKAKLDATVDPITRDNPIDRGLQIMKNLQNRSARNAAIVSGIFGALSVLLLFGDGSLGDITQIVAVPLVRIAIVLGFFSVGCFLFSMSHMPIITRFPSSHPPKSVFMIKTVDEWENYVAGYLAKFEKRHTWGIWLYGSAIAFISFAILWPLKDTVVKAFLNWWC